MLSTSFEFRSLIAQNSKVEVKATLKLANGQTKYLVGDDFMSGEMSFSDAVSSAGSFDVGAAIINKLDFALNNYDRRFDDYDFTGATITPYIGVKLSNGRIEWLQKGVYGVEQPETYGNTIGITALDNMRKLERPYNDVTTRYPASLRTIVMNICSKCGVTLSNTNFVNNDFVVQERPADDSLTCLAVLAYAAQASGNWARFNNLGYLRLEWYNTAAFEGEDWLDGGTYSTTSKPYSDGDAADGGNFTDYSSGATVEGGEFGNNVYANVFAYSSAAIVTDDVVVTGVRVTAQDKEQDEGDDLEGETALYGSEGYVLEFPDNPLVQYGTASDVAERVGKRVVGMRFRPFDVSALGDPSIEAGDPIILTDHLQNQYRSYITALTYKVGAYETFACNAETPSRNSASSYSAMTRTVVKLRNSIEREKTDREKAIENLAEQLATSSGLYMTRQLQSDGSYIYYMHDKPTLAQSQVVWKLTANAFGISTDGGKTYPYGLDVTGNAILNRIYAIGIDADYITTGALVVKNSSGATIFSADKDTKQVYISGDCISLGSESLPTAINGIRALYGMCNTGQSTATKVVTCSGFQLRAGAVVNVKFTYKNTASQPKLNVNNTGAKDIYINNAVMTSDYYWNAGDVVTFVYSGTYWYVADSGTLAKIKTTSDSIVLSVSQTYATKSELTLGLNSITLGVSNAKLGSSASIELSVNGSKQTKTVDLTGVRNAFKNDTSAITITGGVVTFNSNTFVVNSTNFSVTATGVITAKSGTIGGFTIGTSSIYKSKSSLGSGTYGVYVGTDGISVGSGSAYTALAGGYLYGGGSKNSTHGYVGFNNKWTPTNTFGTRLAGRGCIALLTNGAFGIGSYYNFGSDATITTGQSGSITYIDDISATWTNINLTGTYNVSNLCQNLKMNWHWTTIHFTKGLMTTTL